MPLFSIVIPVLNQVGFVERALRSVLSQSCHDFEIIVADGGSTDGTVDILNRYAERITWQCSEKDSGQSDALNKGFAHAAGDYLFWLNADDVLLPDALESIARVIGPSSGSSGFRASVSRPRWIVGNMMVIDENDRILRCLRDGAWHDFLYRHVPVRVYGPSAVFHRSLFEAVGGFDVSLQYAMDTDLWLRFQQAGARYVRVNRYLWGFRYHFGSKTNGGGAATEGVQSAERQRIYLKNGLTIKGWNLLLNRLFRLLNGAYLLAMCDTLRLRGTKI